MSKVRLLQAYLTERLTVLVKEILDVVEDTVTEYREETARTQRENESLRRQLRDILLLEAETEWLRSTRSTLGFVAPQQSDDPDRRPCSENSDTTLSQPKPPPVSKPTVEPVISVQLLSIQSDAPPGPLNLPEDQKPLEPWDPALKADPPNQTLEKSSPLPSHSSTSLPKIHVEVPVVVQEESGAPATIKTEPQEFHLSDPEGVTDSVAPPVVEPCFRSRTEPAHLPVQHQNSSQTAPEEDRPAPPNPGLTPELVHRCPRCGEAFGHAAGLLKHLEQKRKTYACEWCCKSFAQSADLRRHLRTHTGERPHRCTFCPKSFSQRGNLRRHLRIHTGERPYSCPLCCRCFSDGDTMKKHKRTHSGERPYRCSRCTKTFTSTSGLHIHLIKNLCFMANSERAVQTSLTNNSANQRPPH